MEWQTAERVQKNDAGQFRALIGGEWVPVDRAQKNDAGEFRVMLATPTAPAAPAQPSGIPGPRQELSTGQKIYQTVRDVAAPTVEALGALGGGIVGGGAGLFGGGPVGAAVGGIGGAGLGYGAAKSLIKSADVAMGMAPKETAGQALTRGAKDVIEGATYETGGRLLGPAVGYVGGKIADMRSIPQNEAARIAKNALGPDTDAVVNALRNAKPGTTAAQATADINSPTWQALIQRASERDPRFLRALEQSQGEVSLNALARLAGGTTAAETRAANELAKQNLTAVTSPMRETALKGANLGKYVANEAAAREANDLAVLAGSGTKIDPAQFVKQAHGAEQALRASGVKPLEGATLANQIEGISRNPAFAENDLVNGAVQRVAEGIRRWTGEGGVIDANALEAIRKNAVNAAIANLRPGADAAAQRNLAAGVMTNIKPLIDNAIEGAGGAGWRNYLATHAKGMSNIAEKKLTGEALQLWKTNKDEFVRLVQNESPDAVEKILGPGKYNIATELADSTMQTLREQAQKHLTDLSIKGQAAAGQEALRQIMIQEMPKWRLPSYLSAVASTTNKALQIIESKIDAKTMATLTEALKTPEGAADLLGTLPATERNKVLRVLSNPQTWKPGAAAASAVAAKNALAPRQENQNALTEQ